MNLHEIKKGKKDSIQSFINTNFRERNRILSSRFRSWMLTLAWTRGLQNLDYSTESNKWSSSRDKPWRVRVISNKMLPIVRKQISRLVATKAVWDMIPATPDQQDIEIAGTARKVLVDAWIQTKLTEKLVRLAFWMSTCCTAFLKVGWDFEKGSDISIDVGELEGEQEEFLQFVGIQGTEQPKDITVKSGDLFIDVIPPFNLTFQSNIDSMEDAQWVIESQIRTIDYITERYGSKWKDKLQENEQSENYVHPFVNSQQNEKEDRKGILVHELFIRKGGLFKKGLHAIISQDEFLQTPQNNPFEHGQLPYAKFTEIYDGTFYGTCVAEQIRPKQALYNRLQSAVTEQINTMSNIQWLNPKQSKVKSFDNRPGGVINYQFPFKPEQSQQRPIPAYLERMIDRTASDIQDIASSHDVSEAKAEPGIRSGKAVLALQEADDSVLAPVALAWDESLINAGVLAIQTISQYVTSDRTLQVVGEFNQHESITFSGFQLRGESDGNYWNVRTKTSGRQYMSRASREAIVRTMFEIGLINPAEDKEMVMHLIGTADVMALFDENASARARQWREVETLAQGQQIPVRPGQNHKAHIEVIDRLINSDKWDNYDPEGQDNIISHREQHMFEKANELAKEQLYVQLAVQQFSSQLAANPATPGDSASKQPTAGTGQPGPTGNPNSGSRAPVAAGPGG